jgi:hypothetical protein
MPLPSSEVVVNIVVPDAGRVKSVLSIGFGRRTFRRVESSVVQLS